MRDGSNVKECGCFVYIDRIIKKEKERHKGNVSKERRKTKRVTISI